MNHVARRHPSPIIQLDSFDWRHFHSSYPRVLHSSLLLAVIAVLQGGQSQILLYVKGRQHTGLHI